MKPNDIEITGQIYEGLIMVLENWSVLNEALSQRDNLPEPKISPGGLNLKGTDNKVRDKLAFYLIDIMSNYETTKEEFRSDIVQIMKENFGVTISDNSDLEVSSLYKSRLLKVH